MGATENNELEYQIIETAKQAFYKKKASLKPA